MATVSGLRLDNGIVAFSFLPSVGLMAKNVDKLGVDIRSFREPLKRSVQQVMAPSFRTNFEVGGRPTWEPLSDVTIQMRAQQGAGDKPLVRSGTLMKVIQQLNIWHITSTAASIQDLPQKIWYGKIQQAGYGRSDTPLNEDITSGFGTAGIPARPFVMIQEPQDRDDIVQVFQKWLDERVARAMAMGRL